MRIFERDWRGIAALTVTLTFAAGLAGLMAFGPSLQGTGPADSFSSKEQAYRAGMKALESRNVAGALPALEFAADRGMLGAQLRLARIYDGEANRDDAKALTYYHMIVNQHGHTDRLHPAARLISEAFRGLAHYYRAGIPEIGMKPKPGKAAQLMRHAASYFRDPTAQFALGRMYAEGDGVARNQRLAMGWLLKASQKRHAPAQAYLGEMLWRADSDDLMRARGLALLALAVNNAEERERGGIEERYIQFGRAASVAEIKRAERFVAAWDGLRSPETQSAATAHLRELRSSPLESAPVGSLVVSVNDNPLAEQNPDSIAGSILGDLGLHLPYDVVATDLTGESPMSMKSPEPAEKFFFDHPSLEVGGSGGDVFDTVKVDRYSGELLSVDAEAPAE